MVFHFIREYDFQSVISASSVIYGFAAFAPLTIWFIFKQFEQGLKFVTIVCLYGYSLLVFIPATVSFGVHLERQFELGSICALYINIFVVSRYVC